MVVRYQTRVSHNRYSTSPSWDTKYHVSGLSQDASMNHPPTEGTHDHGITHAHPVNQSTTRGNVLVQPQYINESRGERRDITATNKTRKQRPHDHKASPVIQRWDSPILIDDKQPGTM